MMKIVLCYIAVGHGAKTADFAGRFASTYHEHPPGAPHDTLVICQGGALKTEVALLFAEMNARFFVRKNDPGYDVTAYLDAAAGPCAGYDIMLCAGESVYFWREGWLRRLVEVWERLGPGLYGPLASNALAPHLNTTCFCCAPAMLRRWPERPRNKKERYEWEHGRKSFWRFVQGMGYPVRLVTWDGDWSPRLWREPPNILWKGDQSNCLVKCNHTDRWAAATPAIKARWSRLADSPFR